MNKQINFNMLSKQSLLLFIIFLGCNYTSIGQGINNGSNEYIPTIVPINPTAANLSEFGKSPVDLYTGRVSIKIPIYNINKDWINLPIYLSYNSGGMKVEDIASWVGMGWSLNFGGNISRQVRGKVDIIDSGYAVNLQRKVYQFITDPHQLDSFFFTNENPYLDMIMNGMEDPEMDFYFINMNGFSGKMFYDTSGHIVSIPNTKMKIQYTNIVTNGGWKITTTDGTQYYFLAQEYSQSTNFPVQPSAPVTLALNNWYISKIVNAQNTDSIIFDYESAGYSYKGLGTEIQYSQGLCGPCLLQAPQNVITTTQTGFTTKRLTKITSNGLEIDFTKKATERCDLVGDFALDKIQIKDWKNYVFNTYQLYQSYRVGNHIETTCSSIASENKRLFLGAFQMFALSGAFTEISFSEMNNFTPLLVHIRYS